MKRFNDLPIRMKLMLGFGIVIVLTVVLAAASVMTTDSVDEEYSYLMDFPQQRLLLLKDIQRDFINMRRTAVTAVLETGYTDLVDKFNTQFNEAYDSACSNIDKYIEVSNNDKVDNPDVLQENNRKLEQLRTDLTEYKTKVMEPAVVLALEGKQQEAKKFLADGGPILTACSELVTAMCDEAVEFSNEVSGDVTEKKDFYSILFIALSVIIVFLSIVIAVLISSALTKPLSGLLDVTNSLVKGNLNVNRLDASNDEIGRLTQATYKLIDIILLLIKEMGEMAEEFDKGDIEAHIDVSHFEGSYRSVAEGVNQMTSTLVNDILAFMECLKEFGDGNFNADIDRQPGKKAVMNENLDTLRSNLKSVAEEIGSLVSDASEGKLESRADVKRYKGDWAELLNGLNRLMEAIARPIHEAAEVLQKLSQGNFDYKVAGNYQGDFLMIKSSINDTVTNMASYINEISSVLIAMSDDDNLDQSITREYVGKFADMKNALNKIIVKLNDIMSGIYTASEQVAEGAKQISESSMTLAEGASEQASAVEELNATIITINESTMQNAESAKEADNLAATSKDGAQKGDRDMNDMLTSMDGINESSNNIAKIIKVIDDIASQTNLLALNAAVEAARAGEHGKGFSVVAEEVGSLAGKSLAASKEIAGLIDESISRVGEGSKMAAATAGTLHTIVDGVVKVSDIVAGISKASEQQAEAISQVTLGLTQITEVVQNNSATSEEAASASQELSSQAEVLRNLVSVFKLKRT